MGTLKVGKLWYACEATRFFRYSSETVDDGAYYYNPAVIKDVILVPSWKDVNGVERQYMYSPTLGYRLGIDSYAPTKQILSLNSFDSVTIPHLTSDILSNWSENDYLINEAISSTYETFNVCSKSQNKICKKFYIKTGINNTNSNITISCIRFEKTVAIADPISITPQGRIDGNIIYASGIYASYYLDTAVIIEPGEYKEIEIEISPDFLFTNNINIKKQTAWYSREGCRLGLTSTTGAGTSDRYEYDEIGYSDDYMKKVSTMRAYDFPDGPEVEGSNTKCEDITYLKSFMSHGLGVIVTDEPLSSYDETTHNSIWPDSFYKNLTKGYNIAYRTFPHSGYISPSSATILTYFLQSKCNFSSDKSEVVYTIRLRNTCKQNIREIQTSTGLEIEQEYVDFTVRCLRFLQLSYDAVWPGDNELQPSGSFGNFGFPYITYYLPTPIIVPKFETRKIEIHISPLGITVS